MPCPKLSGPFSGPFSVTAVDGVNVTLQLPDAWGIHPVFHQSLVKPYYGVPPDETRPGPVPLSDDEASDTYEVEAIRAKRRVNLNGKRTWEYLCKWKGYPESDNLWQAEHTLGNAGDLVSAFNNSRRRRFPR